MVVISLAIFWVLHGSNGNLDLTLAEKLVLALGGTVGVLGFVGVPAVALHRTGFRLRPRLMPRDERLRSLMRLSGWAVLQHAGIGILLGAAIVLGNRVEGGVVAYQFAFVLFLAPYAILAHPVQTTIQNELTLDAHRDEPAFARGVRWAADSMALLVLPVTRRPSSPSRFPRCGRSPSTARTTTSTSWLRRSPHSGSASSRTASSCSSRGRSTRAGTAAPRRSSRS